MTTTVVHYVPIVTTLLAFPFAFEIFRRYRAHPDRLHLLWWAIGIAVYGAGTLTEALTSLIGWREPVFRAWYITGALLGGAPLAQGTVYLLFRRRVAHALTVALLVTVAVASIAVLSSPIDYSQVETHRLTGRVFAWPGRPLVQPVPESLRGRVSDRRRDPVGAALQRAAGDPPPMWANVLIATGAILPGIGGTATRMGYTEVLYVTELIGLVLTWAGYRLSVRAPAPLALRQDTEYPPVEAEGETLNGTRAHRPAARHS
jgi:hypothetical protein